MDRARYFDNAATTPLDPRVREAMAPFLDQAFGNASSLHAWGLQARNAVEWAREQVARLIGAEDPSQIYFTSGATESNNWVLNAADEVVISPFEHSSLREPTIRRGGWILESFGGRLPGDGICYVKKAGVTEKIRAIRRASQLGPETPEQELVRRRSVPALQGRVLTSVMAVNNETGAIWDVRQHAQKDDILHADITQAVGKLPVALEGLDYASFSGHKFYGPKGIGALYCKNGPPAPLILGGEQEYGARGGTLNVAGIVGMGAAAEIAMLEREGDYWKAEKLREILIDRLKGLPDTQLNGGDRTSPFIVSVSFRGLEGETIVLEMDRAGYAVSAGAACSSRSLEPSHVLTALNLSQEWLRGTVRISFGRFNTEEATIALAQKVRTTVEMLRTL
ncbi:MAG TPA: cysteine desulfurase family protein [Fimbriimonadaceae bacterium]|nr:cysteine desulfurase family protein [Fimbriimonadaceae bacterium]